MEKQSDYYQLELDDMVIELINKDKEIAELKELLRKTHGELLAYFKEDKNPEKAIYGDAIQEIIDKGWEVVEGMEVNVWSKEND